MEGVDVLPFLGLPPTALRIMLSMRETVLELTLTAWPLTAWTPERPLRVLSEVKKTSARGGSAGGSEGVPDGDLVPEAAAATPG